MLSMKTSKLFFLFFLICLVTKIVIGLLIPSFFKFFDLDRSDSIDYEDKLSLGHLFYGVLIAPLFETAIFQKAGIAFSRVYIKNNLICVMITAIIFGFVHHFNVTTMYDKVLTVFVTTCCGLYLGLFYTILKKQKKEAFFLTALFHASMNLFAFLFRYLIK
jgi:Type II CAAX prenyl endopeptidase Rce1-like